MLVYLILIILLASILFPLFGIYTIIRYWKMKNKRLKGFLYVGIGIALYAIAILLIQYQEPSTAAAIDGSFLIKVLRSIMHILKTFKLL